MWTDFYYDSCGIGRIHACIWAPGGEPKAIIQIIHGIGEHSMRYDHFAEYLTTQGYMVVAEDHMGHGLSIGEEGTQGYFEGGWFNAVDDSVMLMNYMKEEFPGTPYVLFGHSMGSFLTRSILAKYPDSGIAGAIICGTGWQPRAALPAMIKMVEVICNKVGEKNPSEKLDKLVFGGYNKKVEHVRTPSDWLTRDNKIVDAYRADPLCGFIASTGLIRDMLKGIQYIELPENLAKMDKKLPVWFIAGSADPVGNYGKGVIQAAEAFKKAGMEQVDMKLYPLCRHEIHNEINKDEVYQDVANWLADTLKL